MSIRFTQCLPVAALLLAASLANAATVTITPSTLSPTVGSTFTVTITADVPNTFAATMALSFDANTVAYLSGATLSPWNVFIKNSPVDDNPTVFDVETPSATGANPGVYDVAILTFEAIAAGAASILIDEDGGTFTGWFDADTADYIPNDYEQASITVLASGPVVTLADSVVPVDDAAVPFGDVTEGSTSAAQTVTVTNTGNEDLLIGLVADADALAPPFALVADTCSGQVLPPLGSCTFDLQFAPVATGAFTDSLDIPSDDPDLPAATVQVTGTGAAVPVPDIDVTDSRGAAGDLSLAYGDVVDGSSASGTVTITNAGTGNLVLGAVADANALAAPFSIGTDNCSGQTLAPAATCTVTVLFAPGAAQSYIDAFDIPSDDPDEGSVVIAVTGMGTAAPAGSSGGSSAADPALVLGLALFAAMMRRRR